MRNGEGEALLRRPKCWLCDDFSGGVSGCDCGARFGEAVLVRGLRACRCGLGVGPPMLMARRRMGLMRAFFRMLGWTLKLPGLIAARRRKRRCRPDNYTNGAYPAARFRGRTCSGRRRPSAQSAHRTAQPAGRIDVHHHFAPPYRLASRKAFRLRRPASGSRGRRRNRSNTMIKGGCKKRSSRSRRRASLSATRPQTAPPGARLQRLRGADARGSSGPFRASLPPCRCPISTAACARSPTRSTRSRPTASACSRATASTISAIRSSGRSSKNSTAARPWCSFIRRHRRAVRTRWPPITDADIEYGTDTTRAIARMFSTARR